MKHVFILSLIVVFSLMSILYLYQRNLIYFPAKTTPKRENYNANDMKEIHLVTKDNLSLLAWYKPAQRNLPTLLYLHGNGGHIGFRMPLIREFLTAGLGVLLLEYRGYGGNPGTPTEKGLYLDAQTALDFLHNQHISENQLIIYGESLGTGVATEIASNHSFCAVILQSPYTSLPSVAAFHYPWILLTPWDKFNSLGKIKNLKTPLLILHGEKDSIVPFQEGLELYKAAHGPKEFKSFPLHGHNDLWNSSFYNQILNFILKNCENRVSYVTIN